MNAQRKEENITLQPSVSDEHLAAPAEGYKKDAGIKTEASVKETGKKMTKEASDADLFKIVGANYKTHTPKLKQLTIRQKLKGKPIASLIVFACIALGCIFAFLIANHDPAGFYLKNLNQPPNPEFYFGTDSLGRDIFSMIWYGGRVSLIVGLLGAAITAIIGTVYGSLSGTAGEKADSVLMRITEMSGSIPGILLILVITAVFNSNNVITLSVVIGITAWFGLARIVRSEVRQIRNSDYVLYARSIGGRFLYIFKQHLVPNFIAAIMFAVVSSVGTAITMESTLSFLGLGLPVDVISWGSMLSLANKALVMNTWWVIIFPGVFLITTLVCITNTANFYRKEINKMPSNL